MEHVCRMNVSVERTCLYMSHGYNCSVEEKLEFKRGEDVLEGVEKLFYLGDMISCYGGGSEAVSTRICSAWKRFRKLSGVLFEKQDLSLKQRGRIYQCCVKPVLLYCCEMWKLSVANETVAWGGASYDQDDVCGETG